MTHLASETAQLFDEAEFRDSLTYMHTEISRAHTLGNRHRIAEIGLLAMSYQDGANDRHFKSLELVWEVAFERLGIMDDFPDIKVNDGKVPYPQEY